MEIRPYQRADRDRCLQVFDSNTPPFFAPSERTGFEAFLDRPDCPYFVMEHDGALIGCGGYALKLEQPLASMVWGLIQADKHRLGLGRYLLLFRLREIGKAEGIEVVQLETSQLAAPFFEKQGFKVSSVIPDGFASGLDRVAMVKKLTVCA